MLNRIRQNSTQIAATIAVAAITYALISMMTPRQPMAPQALSDLANRATPESLAAQANKKPPGSQSEAPQHDNADSRQPSSGTAQHQFSEQEKLIFASLPPMCVPPMTVSNEPKTPAPARSTPPNHENPAVNNHFAKLASNTHTAADMSPRNQAATYNAKVAADFSAPKFDTPLTQQAAFNSPPTTNSPSSVTAELGVDLASFQDAVKRAVEAPAQPTQPPGVQHASVASLHSFNGPTHNPPSDPTLKVAPGEDPHAEIYSRTAFPSAKQCAQCHKQIYEEWSSSSHAYASISPMFHVFEDTINRLSQGTIGYFCYRCHSPVSTTLGLRRDQPIWDGPRVFREGVTCVACHRVKTPFGKVNGERRIEPGDIYDPVYGAGDGHGVAIAEKYSQVFKVKTKRSTDKRPGQPMHRRAIQFEELSKSTFCMSCHQVAVQPGIKLEVVWDQYRASPAYRDGVTCQDCHMGIVPGLDEGYSVGPGAVVNNKVINPEKKHSNHVFYGPGYSIAHPGVFPDNLEADRWTVPQWLEFDWRAGWGTDRFEDALADGKIQWSFPSIWQEADDRYDAREIVDINLKKLEYKRDLRRQLLENGSQLDGPFFTNSPQIGEKLNFRYCITNRNTGHNMPSGSLGAQPQIWLNAVLIDPHGNRIWETGYMDSNGDLADNHSLDVLARKIALDTQLVNLQTKFLTTNVKGTDREMYLPVNFDFDQLPFLRPPQQPVSVQNHPPFIRMEGHSIPPLGKRNAKFSVPARLLQIPGTYRLSVRMRSRAEPIYFMRFCNATPEMQRMMNEWICDFHTATVSFEVR